MGRVMDEEEDDDSELQSYSQVNRTNHPPLDGDIFRKTSILCDL